MKAPGTAYYFSGDAIEEQPKQITSRMSTLRASRCTPLQMEGGAVDPEVAGGVDPDVAVWRLSRSAHAQRHPSVHVPPPTTFNVGR